MARCGTLNKEEKEFEARVLDLFRRKRRDMVGIWSIHRHSKKDLAAGAGVEDRQDSRESA